ncbi:polar amino acid transport system substrate-binding protein [Formivibrio citricus]|uniref:Polar amino acid transport system substrate-binding protein n=1 Tax=Formivibrio citricus TaxID=83765 RepID=A0A1I4YQ78_9NEIS|nr:polar amino acid transport system substrate-binding protein [Formivibrio citricus]
MKTQYLTGLLFGLLFYASAVAEPMLWVTEPFHPYSYKENSKVAGPFAEIVQAACDRLKVECTMEIMPWRRALYMAEEGQASGLFGVAKTPEREKSFFLSDPILETAYSFFALDSTRFRYQKIQDLNGYTIGVYGPSATSRALQNSAQGQPVNIVIEVTNLTALKKLIGGRYGDNALVLINREVGLSLAKEEKITNLKLAGDLQPIVYVIGLSRKKVSERQARLFNDAIKELIKEGKVKTILNKHGMRPARLTQQQKSG